MTLGKAFRSLRNESGLSGQQAAEKIGISLTYLYSIEKDRVVPSVDVIEWAEEVYGENPYVRHKTRENVHA